MSTFPQHRVSNSDNLRSGNAVAPNRSQLGVPFGGKGADRYTSSGLALLQLGAPIAADPDGIAASQAVAGAGDLTLAGALTSGGVATLDVPRNIVVDADGTATAVCTVYGTDEYGQAMQENITLNSTTAVLGNKAFKTVTRIAISAATTGNVFVGTGSRIGLPYRPALGGFIRGRLGEDTADAGTYVAPIRTTSTATTADVRGTYAPAGTLNGTNTFSVLVAIDNGPTDADAFGIAQYTA